MQEEDVYVNFSFQNQEKTGLDKKEVKVKQNLHKKENPCT